MYNRYTITISDDYPHILYSLKTLFSCSGKFKVIHETTCGKTLLSDLKKQQTDIVITDFSLGTDRSTIDGFTKLRALHDRFPEVKIVLLTAQKNTAILKKSCDYGVRAIVSKHDPVEETLLSCNHVINKSGCYFSSSFRYLNFPFMKTRERTNMLTLKELEVIRLFSQGYSLADIAKRQNRTISTVSTQKNNAMRRLGVTSNIELIHYAYAQGLI